MVTKKKRKARRDLRHQQRNTALESMEFRTIGVRASTVDDEKRTVTADIATETPVIEYDWMRHEYVPRVLLASGVQMAESRQVPLLDNHRRSSTNDQIGSIRNIRIEGGSVRGDLHFSETARDAWTKVREGHITDVSAGFEVLAETHVKDGTTETIGGREYSGPINVATKWRLREGSITPIGADEQAKLRGLPPHPQRKEFEMNEELRKLCVERGMPADLSDDKAQAWMLDNKDKLFRSDEKKESTQVEQRTGQQVGGDGAALMGELGGRLAPEDIEAAFERFERKKLEQRKRFVQDVRDLCELAGVEYDRSYADAPTLEEARAMIKDTKAKAQENVAGARIRLADSQPADRGRQAIGTALQMRVLQGAGGRPETIDRLFPPEQRSKDADQFRYASLLDMAKECLRFDGLNPDNHTREDIALAAFGFTEQSAITSRSAAYHTTSSFKVLTQDAINKSMMVGYTEAPSTWRGPMRQASSVADFKDIHRILMGAVPNIPVWPDNTDPKKVSFADAEEVYAVESRSAEISFSYKLLVNDDMDSLSRVPLQMGQAAARTVNAFAWSLVTSNPTMRDGQPLFLASPTGARYRSNLTTGGVSDYTASIQTMTSKMMVMRGENTPEGAEGDDVLAIQPVYIVAPAALHQVILQQVRSTADPNATHSGVVNTQTYLQPIIEPLLDAASTTAFYLFASPSQIDTVELAFLQGQESPLVRTNMDHKTLSMSAIVLQTFGGKPMNHRGIQKHDGA